MPTFSKRTMVRNHIERARALRGPRLARSLALKLFSSQSETLPRMILTCPQCETRYQADAAKFPAAGRSARCAKCGNVWHQIGPEPQPDPDAEIFVQEAGPPPTPATRAPAQQ